MKKKKLEKLISSIIGSQIDHEPLEGKKDVKGEVDKILKLISTEEKDLNSMDKLELVHLVENLHRSYQSLYGQYNNLIWNLQKSVPLKKEAYGDSSDSDSSTGSSESNEFVNDNENFRTPRMGFEESEYYSLQSQIESLKNRNEMLESEAALMLSKLKEGEHLAVKLAERNREFEELRDELQSARGRINNMETEKANLQQGLEISKEQQADVNQRMSSVENENKYLISEKSESMIKLRGMQGYSEELKAEIIALKNELLKLEDENFQLQIKLDELSKVWKIKEDEENKLKTENLSILARIQVENLTREMEHEAERLKDKNSALQQTEMCQISELETKLEGNANEVSTLQKEIIEVQNEASIKRKTMMEVASNLQQEVDLLRSQKMKLEDRKHMMTEYLSKGHMLMDEFERKLTSRISAQERILNEQKDRLDELTANYKLMKHEIAETKLKEKEAMCLLEMKGEKHKKERAKLEASQREASEKLKRCEAEIENADKEVAKLHELVQTLEVHLRLLDQKLKITKSEFKEKGEIHKRKMKEMQQNCKNLEDHCNAFYEEVQYLERELKQIKEVMETGLASIENGFQNLESAIEENCGCFLARISECSKDLRILKLEVHVVTKKKQELQHEKDELIARVTRQEATVSMLKVMCQELEKRVREREEEGLLKDEKKREAIRQLCLLIEYHRENCNHLLQNIPANFKGI